MSHICNFSALTDFEILDKFELLVEEWFSEQTSPPNQEYLRETDFNISVAVAPALSRYWEICRRFPNSTISGFRHTKSRHLATEEIFVRLNSRRNGVIGVKRKPSNPTFLGDPNIILNYATQTCRCCFSAIQLDKQVQWRHYEFDSSNLDPDQSSLINSLLNIGLGSITANWESEVEDGEFEPLRYEAQTLWTNYKWEYWYHPSGFMGKTQFNYYSENRNNIRHWVGPRTKAARIKLIGR